MIIIIRPRWRVQNAPKYAQIRSQIEVFYTIFWIWHTVLRIQYAGPRILAYFDPDQTIWNGFRSTCDVYIIIIHLEEKAWIRGLWWSWIFVCASMMLHACACVIIIPLDWPRRKINAGVVHDVIYVIYVGGLWYVWIFFWDVYANVAMREDSWLLTCTLPGRACPRKCLLEPRKWSRGWIPEASWLTWWSTTPGGGGWKITNALFKFYLARKTNCWSGCVWDSCDWLLLAA